MDLKTHYDTLFQESARQILKGNYTIDGQIDNKEDRRFGITLLIRLCEETRRSIRGFLEETKAVEPNQYYYPDSDLHVTVLSVISCYDGFRLSDISVSEYVKIIEKSLDGINGFAIAFRGITASPAAVLIQGFQEGIFLDALRNNLRDNFRDSGLQQSIDKRYTIATAHATVMRFRAPLRNSGKLMEILEKYREHDFGTCKIDKLQLVFNDWYQREESTQLIKQFDLG